MRDITINAERELQRLKLLRLKRRLDKLVDGVLAALDQFVGDADFEPDADSEPDSDESGDSYAKPDDAG